MSPFVDKPAEASAGSVYSSAHPPSRRKKTEGGADKGQQHEAKHKLKKKHQPKETERVHPV